MKIMRRYRYLGAYVRRLLQAVGEDVAGTCFNRRRNVADVAKSCRSGQDGLNQDLIGRVRWRGNRNGQGLAVG